MLDYYQLVQGWKEIKNEFNFLATKRNQTVIQRYIRAKFFFINFNRLFVADLQITSSGRW